MLSSERAELLVGGAGPPDRTRRLLAAAVERALSDARPSADGTQSVARVEVPLEMPLAPGELLRWLRGSRLFPKIYWSGREDGGGVSAVGVADAREGDDPRDAEADLKRVASLLASGDPRARYYGGLRFDPARGPGEDWAAFGAYRFVLPRFELRAADGPGSGSATPAATLACNLVLPRDARQSQRAEILAQIGEIPLRPAPARGVLGGELPAPVSRRDVPDRAGWGRNVEEALAAFGRGRLGKVVLARRAGFGFAEAVDPYALAENLVGATPGSFHFFVEPEEGAAFLGASPERLFRRQGRYVESEAVAGTRPRGLSDADDEGLRDELLRSEKDLSEHGFVRVGIREALGRLCDALEVEEDVCEMRLASRRHLVSRVRGKLRDGTTDAQVLRALHPTPAVGGYPKGEALREIRLREGFDRGLYAGPICWIGRDSSEFAVGIRSGLLRGRELALYSGAGIVPGSEPEEEWAEIEGKIGDFLGAFGLGPGHAAR